MQDARPIRGSRGYSVTSEGDVYGPRGKLKAFHNSGGYERVSITRDGVQHNAAVHRLVIEAFVGPRPSPMHEVAHGDGDRRNNRADNLRWVTRQGNVDDRHTHGTTACGESSGAAVLTAETVREIRTLHAASGSSYAELSRVYGTSYQNIMSIVKRRTWKHI